jgi:hypothetical protein
MEFTGHNRFVANTVLAYNSANWLRHANVLRRARPFLGKGS